MKQFYLKANVVLKKKTFFSQYHLSNSFVNNIFELFIGNAHSLSTDEPLMDRVKDSCIWTLNDSWRWVKYYCKSISDWMLDYIEFLFPRENNWPAWKIHIRGFQDNSRTNSHILQRGIKAWESLWVEVKKQTRTWGREWKNHWIAEVSSKESCLWHFFILVMMGELTWQAWSTDSQVSPLKSKSDGQQEICGRSSLMCPTQWETWGQILLAENKNTWKNPLVVKTLKSSVLTEIFLELLCKKKILDAKYRRLIISFEVLYKIKSKNNVCRYLGN